MNIPLSDIIEISIIESTRTLYHVKPGLSADSQIYHMAKITYRVESGDSQPQHKVEDIVIGKGTMFEDFLSRIRIDELVELFSISKTTQVKELIFLNFE